MSNKETIQELIELNSMLVSLPSQQVYAVPEGYFEGFATEVLARIKALETGSAREELSLLSPILAGISKTSPFTVPDGYFGELDKRVMETIHQHEDYQTADEELSTLSPLLSSLNKQNPYSVPQGYFENLENNINLKTSTTATAKTVSMINRKWFRYAAAAVVAGFITLTGIQFLNKNSGTVSNPTAWVEKNMNKVSTDEINKFIQIADGGSSEQNNNLATSVKTDIKDLMKDVSDNDIQDFLNKTSGNDELDADLLLN